MYGAREGIDKYSISGSNSLWNMLEMTPEQNNSWKKIIPGRSNFVLELEDIKEEGLKQLSYHD